MSHMLTLTEAEPMKEKSVVSSFESKESVEEDAREAELIVFENTTEGLGILTINTLIGQYFLGKLSGALRIGLKICGGCSEDGKEVYGIFIKRVLPLGLAALTGEVFDGDLILEVNGQSMQGVTYERAVSMLRQASASNHVELVITRDAEARREFANYLTKFAPILSPFSTDKSYSSTGPESGAERNLESFKKDVTADHNLSFEQLGGLFSDVNGHASPTSSCASEIVNHMGEHTSPALLLSRPLSNGSNVSRGKEFMTDSLDTLLSKKLAQDPGLKLHIEQLESALTNLGLQLTPSSIMLLRQHLIIDITGMVRFEEFVEAAKIVFHQDLGALKGRLTPQFPNENTQIAQITEDFASVVKERDLLKAEIASLKEELHNRSQSSQNAEEQLLFIRKQAQSSIEEVRSLKSKLHLAEQAQAKAQQTERDYEEVVAMLENEVGQLRMQMSKSDGVNMQKRLAVLVCQLKKAESGKKTYEVATEKLMRFVEHSLETLALADNRSTVEGNNAKLSKKRALLTLSNEGREVIRTVRSLMETVPLPFGWEEAYTSEGVKYYINHLNQTTTWTHPVSCMEHQTTSKSPPTEHKHETAAVAPSSDQGPHQSKHSQADRTARPSSAKSVLPPPPGFSHKLKSGDAQAVS